MRRVDPNSSDVLAFWQPRSARSLKDSDARQISGNMTGFILVLLDWENKERREIVADKILTSDANGEDN
jgi:hypothetical protein